MRMKANLFAVLALLAGVVIASTANARLIPRIIGGEPALPGEFPYMAALVDPSSTSNWAGQFCGGTLVSAEWVLTAAHCVMNGNNVISPREVVIVLGENTLRPNSKDRIAVDVIIPHQAYYPGSGSSPLYNDVALLHLKTPQAIALPDLADVIFMTGLPLEHPVTSIGWGYSLNDPFLNTPNLQKIALEYRPHDDEDLCQEWSGEQPSVLCAAIFEEVEGEDELDTDIVVAAGKGACYGDSGSALLVPGAPDTIIGVTSYGPAGCATSAGPAGYANVGYLNQWIVDTQLQADVAVNINSADPTPADEFGTFIVTVRNLSPVNAAAPVTIKLFHEATFRLVNLDSVDGCSAATFECVIPTLGPGDSVKFELLARDTVNDGLLGSVSIAALSTFADDYNSNNDMDSGTFVSEYPQLFSDIGGSGSAGFWALGLLGLLGLRRLRC